MGIKGNLAPYAYRFGFFTKSEAMEMIRADADCSTTVEELRGMEREFLLPLASVLKLTDAFKRVYGDAMVAVRVKDGTPDGSILFENKSEDPLVEGVTYRANWLEEFGFVQIGGYLASRTVQDMLVKTADGSYQRLSGVCLMVHASAAAAIRNIPSLDGGYQLLDFECFPVDSAGDTSVVDIYGEDTVQWCLVVPKVDESTEPAMEGDANAALA